MIKALTMKAKIDHISLNATVTMMVKFIKVTPLLPKTPPPTTIKFIMILLIIMLIDKILIKLVMTIMEDIVTITTIENMIVTGTILMRVEMIILLVVFY